VPLSTCLLLQTAEADRRSAKNKKAMLQITPEARGYAIRELARRAGVSRDFFDRWKIEITPGHTVVSFGSESSSKIRFVHASADLLEKIARGPIPVASAGWLDNQRNGAARPDLILPFCDSEADSHEPLYRPTVGGGIICRLDILSSMVFTLSRVEETLCEALDEHGRFPASASLAVRDGFLERPVLDELGLAFQQALSFHFPAWQPAPRVLRCKLTHDIDDIGIPFNFRTSFGHTLRRRRPVATLRDLLARLTPVEPAELALVRTLAATSTSRSLHSAFYWKASPAGPRDSGYDPAHGKIQRLLDFLRESGFELGVHPGYDTFGNRPKLANEVACLRKALRVNSPGGRQHYLRWAPNTWLDWEACGLSYDSSLGFADHFGFRAGTAFPYRPWSLLENRELNLIEVPLILMDCTAVRYMKLTREEGLRRIRALIQRIAQSGGVFTLLWHNTPLLDPEYDGWYESILDLLAGARCFDVPSNVEGLW